METIKITGVEKPVVAAESILQHSSFTKVCLNHTVFNDVAMAFVQIINADLSNMEIDGAQLGGAYIHNVGMPPEGHPAYDPQSKHAPLKFECCDLVGTVFTDCKLNQVSIIDCDLQGMKIDGILVTEMLKQFKDDL